MSARLHKWMAKKGVGGGGAPDKVPPSGTIPTRAVEPVSGNLPAVLATSLPPPAPQGQGSGGDWVSPVPGTIITANKYESDVEPPTRQRCVSGGFYNPS